MTTKKIVLIVVGVVVVLSLLIAVFIGGMVGFAVYSIGKSEAAVRAKDFLRKSEKLKQDTGEVKDFGSFVTGSGWPRDGNSEAILNLKVIGEKKTVNATVHLLFVKGSDWRVTSASYVNESGQKINLLDPYDSKLLIPVLIA
jgi:hypothetical protein